MKYRINGTQNSSGTRVSTKCPHCGHNGTFESVGNDINENSSNLTFGLRRCPNQNCFGHLFFVYDRNSKNIVLTYPSETIPFNKEGIPERVLNAFEEAVICHSQNCFVASAIMLRKTLEEICLDRNATGKNLYKS